jgi:hypothetical protein
MKVLSIHIPHPLAQQLPQLRVAEFSIVVAGKGIESGGIQHELLRLNLSGLKNR